MINAWGGAQHQGQLKVNTACTEANSSCRFTFESAAVTSGSDSSLGMNAWGGAQSGTPLKLYRGCPVTNTNCTWTFSRGLIKSDTNPTLAMRPAALVVGGELGLSPLCALGDTTCTWTISNGRITNDQVATLHVNAYGGAAHGTPLKLYDSCPTSNPDCVFDVGSPPPVQGDPTVPTDSGQKSIPMGPWENVLLAVPPDRAGCGANGAVFISEGNTPKIKRADLSCMTSTAASCTWTQTTYGSAAWPLVNVAGFTDDVSGSSDSQLIRQANGSLLLLHQGIRRDAGSVGACLTPGNSTCRGAEYVFRSADCGATWTHIATLDPKSDGPPSEPDRCHNYSVQSGHDRPEFYADPYNPGRVYTSVICLGDSSSNPLALYRSDNYGTTWRYAAALPDIWTGAYLTTISTGRLYIAGWKGSGSNQIMGLLAYDPATDAVTGSMNAGSTGLARHPLRIAAGSEGLARVGRFSDGDYLRVHNTFKNASNDYALKVSMVRVWGSTATIVSQATITPPAGTSIVGAQSIESDRLDWVNNSEVNPSAIFWYEVDTSDSATPGNWGPARARYVYQKGQTLSNSAGCLSLPGASCRTVPTFNDGVHGDYQKGAFWFDVGSNTLRFMAFWGEQGATNAMRTNFFTVPVWD
jgi:hypothetical protein